MRTMMLRGLAAVAVLALCVAAGAAAAKAKKHTIQGVVKTVDPASGALTVTVKKKNDTKDVDFTIDDSVKVLIFAGKDKQVLAGKAALTNAQVKVGAKVRVTTDADNKVTQVAFGDIPHNTTAKGKIKKVDAAAGVLTVTVKKKKQETDTDFRLEDATKVTIYTADQPKNLVGKDGLKGDDFKEGADVVVVTSPDGKVVQVRLGTPPKKK